MIDTRAFIQSLNGKPVAIFGLGISGLPTAKALKASKGTVFAWDDNEEKRIEAARAGIELSDFVSGGLEGYGALILAPGIPLHFPAPHPAVVAARDAGVEIIGDIEVLHRSGHATNVIGITGTNGKSTTTALISHILTQSGYDAPACGNIGKAVLDLNATWKTIPVLELSSYQMDLCPTFRPNLSVLLNITPDHLDRHGSFESYAAAKEKIFEGQGIAICSVDDPLMKAIDERVKNLGQRKSISISVGKQAPALSVYVENGHLFDYLFDKNKVDAAKAEAHDMGLITDIPSLVGSHNHQNIIAAYAVCREIGMDGEEILRHIRTYPGLPHRQQLIRVINGIAYINDSKATNAEAAGKAIACYNNIYLIAGGEPKEGGLNGLEPLIDHLRHVFLIGQATEDFAKWLSKMGVPFTKSGTLDVAVLDAHNLAQADRGQPGGAGTVLLSPACASWDQFNNFEHRGRVFIDLVTTLSESAS